MSATKERSSLSTRWDYARYDDWRDAMDEKIRRARPNVKTQPKDISAFLDAYGRFHFSMKSEGGDYKGKNQDLKDLEKCVKALTLKDQVFVRSIVLRVPESSATPSNKRRLADDRRHTTVGQKSGTPGGFKKFEDWLGAIRQRIESSGDSRLLFQPEFSAFLHAYGHYHFGIDSDGVGRRIGDVVGHKGRDGTHHDHSREIGDKNLRRLNEARAALNDAQKMVVQSIELT